MRDEVVCDHPRVTLTVPGVVCFRCSLLVVLGEESGHIGVNKEGVPSSERDLWYELCKSGPGETPRSHGVPS